MKEERGMDHWGVLRVKKCCGCMHVPMSWLFVSMCVHFCSYAVGMCGGMCANECVFLLRMGVSAGYTFSVCWTLHKRVCALIFLLFVVLFVGICCIFCLWT
jgi:hypothetical protein